MSEQKTTFSGEAVLTQKAKLYVLRSILYKCRTGCQWALIPKCYGSKSSIHEQYQRWVRAGVFEATLRIVLNEYAEHFGFDTQWQAIDGSLIQAPVRYKKINVRRTQEESD